MVPYTLDDGEKKKSRLSSTDREKTVLIKYVNLEIYEKQVKSEKKKLFFTPLLARQHPTDFTSRFSNYRKIR
jgi:hypothetical protein